ncbi:hypothetical protein FRAAL2664 [Frankia alni ACN14a]|uniref:Uncharacterized protein n=1 Tax=Frankia alni (strain DSM 45986 / CECT 9034 / ACN14a) TaxID=326424 RepID=Q0RME1_FRAAA|nr:hypothetical protein FRAAL2664 [Frankia alni ACN14a]
MPGGAGGGTTEGVRVGTTSMQGLPYPAQADPPNGPGQIQALAVAVEPRLVMSYADASDRDSKVLTPSGGMVAWLQNPGCHAVYDGSAWTATPRIRTVANRLARLQIGQKGSGDIAVEQDSGLPFGWDGAEWRGLWPSRYLSATSVPVTGITNEVGIMRLEVPDYGCRVQVAFVVQASIAKSEPSDVFSLNVRNGTGQTPPALSGAVLTSVPWESGISGYIRHAPGNTGVISGAYSIQVNALRFGGSGNGAVTTAASYMSAVVTPVWS